jgi:hypothetical protein
MHVQAPPSPARIVCPSCGVPPDARPFDDATIVAPPAPGTEIVLARFTLPQQYCGILRHFAQFSDAYERDPAEVLTPDFEWRLLANGVPIDPYPPMRHILNPWGYGSFPFTARLDDRARVEFRVRNLRPAETPAESAARESARIGGRIAGWYWFNRNGAGV